VGGEKFLELNKSNWGDANGETILKTAYRNKTKGVYKKGGGIRGGRLKS